MIIARTAAVTTMTTKESYDKSQIRSMGTDKEISDLSPPTYLHYHNHHHHHYHHFFSTAHSVCF